MRSLSKTLILAFMLALACLPAPAQESQTIEAENYILELPSAKWKAVPGADNIHQHTDFIYGDRNDGFLRIRKEMVDAGATLSDMARRYEDVKLRYRPGFVGGKEEKFAGRLNGLVFSYEYTDGGKPVGGRIYFLQADSRTVYVLHFTGMRDKLQLIHNQTDSIARSFRVK